jgi:hypothetical protein
MMSPGCAETWGGSKMSLLLAPTWTTVTFGWAFGVGAGLFGYDAYVVVQVDDAPVTVAVTVATAGVGGIYI